MRLRIYGGSGAAATSSVHIKRNRKVQINVPSVDDSEGCEYVCWYSVLGLYYFFLFLSLLVFDVSWDAVTKATMRYSPRTFENVFSVLSMCTFRIRRKRVCVHRCCECCRVIYCHCRSLAKPLVLNVCIGMYGRTKVHVSNA